MVWRPSQHYDLLTVIIWGFEGALTNTAVNQNLDGCRDEMHGSLRPHGFQNFNPFLATPQLSCRWGFHPWPLATTASWVNSGSRVSLLIRAVSGARFFTYIQRSLRDLLTRSVCICALSKARHLTHDQIEGQKRTQLTTFIQTQLSAGSGTSSYLRCWVSIMPIANWYWGGVVNLRK